MSIPFRRPPRGRYSERAPQKQCKVRLNHDPHHYGAHTGLIWWCQGRRRSTKHFR